MLEVFGGFGFTGIVASIDWGFGLISSRFIRNGICYCSKFSLIVEFHFSDFIFLFFAKLLGRSTQDFVPCKSFQSLFVFRTKKLAIAWVVFRSFFPDWNIRNCIQELLPINSFSESHSRLNCLFNISVMIEAKWILAHFDQDVSYLNFSTCNIYFYNKSFYRSVYIPIVVGT